MFFLTPLIGHQRIHWFEFPDICPIQSCKYVTTKFFYNGEDAFHSGMSFHSAGAIVIFHAVMTEQLNP